MVPSEFASRSRIPSGRSTPTTTPRAGASLVASGSTLPLNTLTFSADCTLGVASNPASPMVAPRPIHLLNRIPLPPASIGVRRKYGSFDRLEGPAGVGNIRNLSRPRSGCQGSFGRNFGGRTVISWRRAAARSSRRRPASGPSPTACAPPTPAPDTRGPRRGA